jgi:RNA polymerase sigma factor (sigma-70 family)
MISEGNVGLMQAVKKFEPEKGFRLATYAMWWIKAAIQEYILRSWSLVKIGTTTAQKKLFFNLKKLKNQIAPRSEGDLRNEQVSEIANKLNVREEEVVSMNRRLAGKEYSLPPEIVSKAQFYIRQRVRGRMSDLYEQLRDFDTATVHYLVARVFVEGRLKVELSPYFFSPSTEWVSA